MANVEKIVPVQQMIFYGKTNDSMIKQQCKTYTELTANYKTKQGLNHTKESALAELYKTIGMPLSDQNAQVCTNLKIPLRICIHKHDIRLFTKK